MNFLLPTYYRPLAVLVALAALCPAALRAADVVTEETVAGTTARVKFSDPTKPGTLKLALPWAEVHITATDGNEVVVTSTLDQKNREEVDSEGFRRLDEDVTFELIEKDNLATINVAGDNLWATQGAEFEIKVPRTTNLVIRTELGGDLEVDGVEGDLDINSMNGEVTLRDIVSSTVVNTMNGEIKASFKRAPVKPVALSSMNGEIELRLPGDTKANLRLRTHNGSVRTNFPAGALQAKTEKTAAGGHGGQRELQREQARLDRDQAKLARDAAKLAAESAQEVIESAVEVAVQAGTAVPMPPMPPLPPIPGIGGKSIVGTLNGGGVDIKITSMNGTITLREAK